ncbi:MAG: DUF4230 domain-containing protein [Erysipelotrichaceae bacterium]|nr:DUF4230 domain-containing protein [Erysipelotrichaceae bacterium]MDP3305573.1 DUF4230 domain-containing protein [Erysipelotrichaceae bacterium]
MKRKLSLYSMIKILIIVAVAVFVGVFTMNLFNIKLVRDSEIGVSGVLTEIKQISQLDTVEMYFNEILDYREAIKINDIQIPFTEKSFIFVVKAKVQAGIDLASLSEEDIRIEDKKITLTLNKAKITSKEILEYSAYDEKDGLFNRVNNDDTLKTLNEFRVRLDKQAIDSGILTKAEDNAKLVLSSILRLMGFEEIVINFSD